MRLENSFDVPAAPDRAWDFLLDVPRVAPCMPGAEITETVDERTWKGKVSVRLGPVSMAFAGTLVREEIDEEARRVVLRAQATETRGKGAISATITSSLVPEGEGTSVTVVTDLSISGAAAQYGRGMLGDVSQRFTDEFAACISSELSREEGGEVPEEGGAGGSPGGAQGGAPRPGPAAKPVGGVRLGFWALRRAMGRFFRRLLGKGEPGG